MGILDNLGNVLKQVTTSDATTSDVFAAFDHVAGVVPAGDLASGLAHAFQSDQTPPFEQMVAGLFGQSNPQQKAGLLNDLLAALGPAGLALLSGKAGGPGGLAALAGGGTVTPQQAAQVSPEAVQTLAAQAAAKDPSIMEKAAGFYAQHPALVKAIGAGALALLMSKVSSTRR